MSGLINKIKDAVSSDSHNTHNTHGTAGTTEGSHGPHNTRAANAADPRVDSDRDGSHTIGGAGSHAHGTAGNNFNTGNTGTTGAHGTYGVGGTSGGPNTAGPHSSDMANKLDPRVDSDRDGSHNLGSNTGNQGYGTTGTHGSHGVGGNSGYTSGPHSSNLANKADPRVDSDRDGSHTLGSNTGTHGSHGIGGTTGTYGSHGLGGNTGNTSGPHSSNLANKADPRVDSDRDNSHTLGGNTTGTHSAGTHGTGHGYESTHFGGDHKKHSSEAFGGEYGMGHATTGVMPVGASGVGAAVAPGPNSYQVDRPPHKSDLLNKLDPRIDSNTHGNTSGTHGATGTHGNTGTHGVGGLGNTHGDSSHRVTGGYDGKDPRDASQVPPSVMREHLGHPTIEHDDHEHDRARRNSTATHQELHRGV